MNANNITPYSKAVVRLLRGTVEKKETIWNDIINYQSEIQGYISVMGLELIVKKDEGFAFLKQMKLDDDKTMNLVSHRPYGFDVSVMLIVLRQILEDFDSNPIESQAFDKFVTAEEIKEEVELFLPATYNKVKFEKELDGNIEKIASFGFLKKTGDNEKRYKIHRIIKEKITLDDLLDFKNQLEGNDTTDESI